MEIYASREIANWTEGTNDMENELFERLKFSYSRLKDETLRRCFLYCALYPEDHKIPRQELIGYWIAEGLITERIGGQAATDKGHTILNKLENTCLLEGYSNRFGEKWVKVHDVIREMALNITKVSPRFMVQAGLGLTESLSEDWSGDLERVSLMYNRIESLSFSPPRCQKLSTLLLQRNPLVRILNSFFCHMQSLRVLDLSYTRIESLPDSISLLANLRELSLDHCHLSHLPSLEKLKALRKLKLGYTKILELPPGIEELINLKILDLYHTCRPEMPLRGKLAHLSQLKCLRIDRSNIKVWAEELLSLRELEILGASYHDLQKLNNYVKSQHWQELTTYRLLLGDDVDVESYTIRKEVWVINCHPMSGGGDFLMVPSNILDFKIIRCHDIRSLTEISSWQNARDLKTCYVEYCVGIESIFHSLTSKEEQHYIPKSLENLILSDLPFLRVVFRGAVPSYSPHSNLKKLIIYHCSNLRYLFLSNSASHLENHDSSVSMTANN